MKRRSLAEAVESAVVKEKLRERHYHIMFADGSTFRVKADVLCESHDEYHSACKRNGEVVAKFRTQEVRAWWIEDDVDRAVLIGPVRYDVVDRG